jgi:hypothetical protein
MEHCLGTSEHSERVAGAERGEGVASTPARAKRAPGTPEPASDGDPGPPPHVLCAVGWDGGSGGAKPPGLRCNGR